MVTALLLSASTSAADEPASDLTIEVGGDLLEHGGVVVVYGIPVGPDAWKMAMRDGAAKTVRIDDRYAEVQLRYLEAGTFAYRFRPIAGATDADKHVTQVLSVIGTDMEGQGPQMKQGFENAYSSGGRVIRVPSMAEIAGQGDATKTAARWGETEGYDAVPPADQRSARALAAILEHGRRRQELHCDGNEQVQVCLTAKDQWPALEATWWRAIAEQRLERLRHRALRECYDSQWFGNGRCEADQQSDEPAYLYR